MSPQTEGPIQSESTEHETVSADESSVGTKMGNKEQVTNTLLSQRRRTLLKSFAAASASGSLLGTFSNVASAKRNNNSSPKNDGPMRFIFDSDMGPDVDDAGAAAVLHTLADARAVKPPHGPAHWRKYNWPVKILGMMCSSSGFSGVWGPPCFDAINTYYKHTNIPIGTRYLDEPNAEGPFSSDYNKQVAQNFPQNLGTTEDEILQNVSGAVDLYREILSIQPDNSVTVVSVGFLSNLQNLLNSESDEHSSLNGVELVDRKVNSLVVMGGEFPCSDVPEFNLNADRQATERVSKDWPSEIVYSGFDIGIKVTTGRVLRRTPQSNPVRGAYAYYYDGRAKDRFSWDLTAVQYAIERAGNLWELGPDGHLVWYEETGNNCWSTCDPRTDNYIEFNKTDKAVEEYYNTLLTYIPPGCG